MLFVPGSRSQPGEFSLRNPVRESCTLGSVRGEVAELLWIILYGHEAGNGGYCQGRSLDRLVASPTRRPKAHPNIVDFAISTACLLNGVCCASDHLILDLFGQVNKIGAKAGDSHHEIRMIFRIPGQYVP